MQSRQYVLLRAFCTVFDITVVKVDDYLRQGGYIIIVVCLLSVCLFAC